MSRGPPPYPLNFGAGKAMAWYAKYILHVEPYSSPALLIKIKSLELDHVSWAKMAAKE